MRVLWITNILFPEALVKLTGRDDFKSSGGWMLGAADELITNDDISLSVATVSPLVNELVCIRGNQIVYYIIPYGKGNTKINDEYQQYWKQVKVDAMPDIVHIHGTEYSHGYAYVKACGKHNVVVSIQGLKSACADFYFAGLTNMDILCSLTIRDLFRETIWAAKRSFKRYGVIESNFLRDVDHIIGRTTWDRAKTFAINPMATYHFCNETLRPEFYTDKQWSYDKCNIHSIFLSQASYPLKGLHQLLKAMPYILKHYPDTKIRIAGADITNNKGLVGFIHYTGYGKYIRNLIKKLNLGHCVRFIGRCNAAEMRQEYLDCNVFVCPSSIENSPNSLGEAQILGVPCLASHVGGIPDMMIGCYHNLYRFDDVEILAYKICEVFARKSDQESMRYIALKRHDIVENRNQLLKIYNEIIG